MNPPVSFARLPGILILAALFICPGLPLAGAGEVFSWRQAAGQSVRVMLNKHPYSDGLRRKLDEFESLTGIKVIFAIYPENHYFQQLDEAFASKAGQPDVYMTGAYQVWEYASAGHMAWLDLFISNPAKTRSGYNASDFFPAISGAFRWDGKAGGQVGSGPLWAIPMGFEICALLYNREVFSQYRMVPPRTLDELLRTGAAMRNFAGGGTNGLAVRGAPEWNSIHAAYITAFVNAGAVDMAVENGILVSKVNSPEAVAVTEQWVRVIKECCPENWSTYDWYRCLADLGSRKAAMSIDANILGYFANVPGASSQSGKLGVTLPPVAGRGQPVKSNLWVWGLAINPASTNLDAAWIFVQYFTSREFQSYSVLEWKSLNPPRRSVFEDPEFHKKMEGMSGYSETLARLIDNSAVCFTPNPHFFARSKRWAEVIVEIVEGKYPSVQAGMDSLKAWMDVVLANVRTE